MKSIAIVRRLGGYILPTCLAAFAAASCEPPLTEADKEFLRLSRHDQAEEVAASAPDEAVELFLLAFSRQVPPNGGAKDALAERGEEVLPALLDTLNSTHDDVERSVLIEALARMQSTESYCVSCDDATMEVIRTAVESIRNDAMRNDSAAVVDYYFGVPAP